MNNRIIQLAKRRTVLTAKIENQRMALAEAISPFRGAFSLADKGLHALSYLRKHPVVVAGIVSFVVATRPKRWLFMLEKGWLVWRLLLAARRKAG